MHSQSTRECVVAEIKRDLKEFVERCEECIENRFGKKRYSVLPEGALERVGSDFSNFGGNTIC